MIFIRTSLLILTLLNIFFSLLSYGFAHDGEHHDDKEYSRGENMLFDEGSGSSSIGEYDKSYDKTHRKDQYTEEGSRGQDQIPASSSPQLKNEGTHGSEGYSGRHRDSYRGHMEEGSGSKRGFPTN